MMSPSSISTRMPRANSSVCTALQIVVLPEPLSPVIQTMVPWLSPLACSGCGECAQRGRVFRERIGNDACGQCSVGNGMDNNEASAGLIDRVWIAQNYSAAFKFTEFCSQVLERSVQARQSWRLRIPGELRNSRQQPYPRDQ
jgi:hypothetical protein